MQSAGGFEHAARVDECGADGRPESARRRLRQRAGAGLTTASRCLADSRRIEILSSLVGFPLMRKIGTGGPCRNRGVARVLAAAALLGAPVWSLAQAPPAFTISTLVGSAGGGFAGDGGPAAAAQINNPCALALDGSGNLYIGDQLNYRVRKIANGNISTVVGTGTAGDTGAGTTGGPAT